MSVSLVLQFDIEHTILEDRVTGRRIHPGSGRIYHVKNNPPKVADKDNLTGEPLVHLPEDNVTALAVKIKEYEE
eukprot:CAMPEP_0201283494 /NCGR_PEP_ID=MMETSP1317-20130820/8698_1 /ASSEMBLY_ACC=CAM_ASM_000770 /TAXON_ID=187299 /ORGANISM="Undescribed Undescribed, Strain Undescribed" /LENGTH=73 /DNA_ID=CAMNT_0047599903 /DNA_START=364 /DNA_END=585 /DNA_ORIENTATION=-